MSEVESAGVDDTVSETAAGGLTALRRQQLVERLQRDRSLRVAALADEFGVSQETIRRDLKHLEDHGELTRVYGGAVANDSGGIRPLVERERIHRNEKLAIARLAGGLVREGASIFIGEGTTTLALARLLARGGPLRCTTNMIDVGVALGRGDRHEIFLAGGRFYPDHGIISGTSTIAAIRNAYYDVAFVGTSSVMPEVGMLDLERELSEMNRALIGRTRRLVVLADNFKFGAAAGFVTFALGEVDTLVTDTKPGETYMDAFDKAGIEVIHP